jgi:hypothetical protein
MKTVNWEHFLYLCISFTKLIKEPAIGTQSNIMQHLENFFMLTFLHRRPICWKSSRHLVQNVSLKLKSRTIFKQIWLIWRQTAGFKPFSRKNYFRNSGVKPAMTMLLLDIVQLRLCYHLDHHACAIQVFPP